jgi:signal transduction histidine kinase
VRGHLDLLDAGVYGSLTDGQHEAIARAQRSAVYLTSLINDLLNFAGLESGRVDYRIEDVALSGPQGVLDDIAALVATQAAAKGVEFVQPPRSPSPTGGAEGAEGAEGAPLRVRADADKVRIILVNLVTNAIKFTDVGGRIALAYDRGPDPGQVCIRISDTGRGVAPDDVERIFEPFVQVDRHRTETSQQGIGLGLAISRTLARGMGGDLTMESVAGAGSTFILTLPAA